MVELNNIDSSNSASSPSPCNLMILERLKRARALQVAKPNDNSVEETVEKPIKKQIDIRKRLLRTRELSSSSSSSPNSSVEITRRTTMQEKLFAVQCLQMRQNKPAMESSLSNNSTSKRGPQNHRKQTKNYKHNDSSSYSSIQQSEISSTSNYQNNRRQKKNFRQDDSSSYSLEHQTDFTIPKNFKYKSGLKSDSKKHEKNYSRDDSSSNSPKHQAEAHSYERRSKKYYNPKDNLGSNGLPCPTESHLYGRSRDGNCSFDDESDSDCVPMAGVLHMKEPLKNQQNESKYYESRGRMEPMDWSVINDQKVSSNMENKENKSRKEINKNEVNQENIKKSSEIAPEAQTAYLNFVKNSVTYKTVYETRDNMGQFQNSVDLSTLKVQKKIKYNHKDSVLVTQEIKKYFEPSQHELHVIDVIDSFALALKRQTETSEMKENLPPKEISENKETLNNMALTETLKVPEKVAVKSSLDRTEIPEKPLAMTNYNTTDFWNTLPASTQGKKKVFQDYDDDMFVFTKSKEQCTSEFTRNKTKQKVFEDSSDDTLSFTNLKPLSRSSSITSSINSISNSHNNTTHPSGKSSTSNSIFNRLKNTCKERSYTSLDSDDMSVEKGSELEDLSFSRKSTSSKFEILRKVRNAATQYSPREANKNVLDEKIVVKQKNEIPIAKEEKEEFLIKEAHTRYFNKPTNKEISIENDVKIMKPKVATEELLKAISTRYFSKPQKIKPEITLSNQTESTVSDMKDIPFSKNVQELKLLKSQSTSEKIQLSVKEEAKEESSINKVEITVKPKQVEKITELNNNALDTENTSAENDTECDFIFHTHENDKKSSLILQEINSDSEESKNDKDSILNKSTNKISSLNLTQNYETFYEGIDPDEEFDFVNVEEFQMFSSLTNKFKEIQKAIQLHEAEMLDGKNVKYINDNNDSIKNKSSNSRSTDSSFEVSDNYYSNISASISSNLETDYETASTSPSSPDFLNNKKNIFENIEIDTNQLKCLDYNDNMSKAKPVISSRKKKMMNALINHQKKSEDIGEGCENTQEQVDSMQNESLRNDEMLKYHQILDEIKKRKLHLKCKPLIK